MKAKIKVKMQKVLPFFTKLNSSKPKFIVKINHRLITLAAQFIMFSWYKVSNNPYFQKDLN